METCLDPLLAYVSAYTPIGRNTQMSNYSWYPASHLRAAIPRLITIVKQIWGRAASAIHCLYTHGILYTIGQALSYLSSKICDHLWENPAYVVNVEFDKLYHIELTRVLVSDRLRFVVIMPHPWNYGTKVLTTIADCSLPKMLRKVSKVWWI